MKTVNRSKNAFRLSLAIFSFAVVGGGWWYVNNSENLGAQDSDAAFMPSYCSAAESSSTKCKNGTASVCRPVRCSCAVSSRLAKGIWLKKGISYNKGAYDKYTVVRTEALVCQSLKDKYVKCEKEVAGSSANGKAETLNNLKNSLISYNLELKKDESLTKAEKILSKYVNFTLRYAEKVLIEDKPYVNSSSAGNCVYSSAEILDGDSVACPKACNEYAKYMYASKVKGSDGVTIKQGK